jgi:hypothetical protein
MEILNVNGKDVTVFSAYEILLENAPYSRELEWQMNEDGHYCWSKMNYDEVIAEVEFIKNKYLDDSFDYYYEIQNGNKEYIQELKELKAVLKHIKKVYKEVV